MYTMQFNKQAVYTQHSAKTDYKLLFYTMVGYKRSLKRANKCNI